MPTWLQGPGKGKLFCRELFRPPRQYHCAWSMRLAATRPSHAGGARSRVCQRFKCTADAPGPVQQPLERVVIVDADNNVAGSATRAEMRARNLIHRSSFIFVHNSAGQLFVQRRVAWKETYPSHYDPAPGGVVGEHETYEQNASREVEEEMGIAGVPLQALFDFFYSDAVTRVWGRAFRCVYDGSLTLQESEVASGNWVDLDKVADLQPCCPDSSLALREYEKRLRAGTLKPVGNISR